MVTFLSTFLIDVDIGLIVKIIVSVMVVMVNVLKASRKGKGSRKYQERIYFETLMLLIMRMNDSDKENDMNGKIDVDRVKGSLQWK